MTNDLAGVALAAWTLAALMALTGKFSAAARALLGIGGLALLTGAVVGLPGGAPALSIPFGMGAASYVLSPTALWLMGFGLPAATLASLIGTPAKKQSLWILGTALSLIGALGVFGFKDAASFLIAWEAMSLGGAVMILGENLAPQRGRSVLFMLALLEVGAVALILAFLLFAARAGGFAFSDFHAAAAAMPATEKLFVGFLLLIGFGAKLGILPFYEWFPAAYGAASGATGAVLSGIVLNAAFFGLSQGLVDWLPAGNPASGVFLIVIGVVSAILTSLYAFQQEDWRTLLSLSSAENGAVSVCLLGAALLFRQDGQADLAGLAWTVALIHLAGHALAKGTMFLTADGAYRAASSYTLVQSGLLARSSWVFGLGALFAAMSLAAMPPQAGFVSEWYLFQTFFQGFHLASLSGRLTMALAGAGLALTAAIAFATYVKAFGIGLLGRAPAERPSIPGATTFCVGLLGFLILALAVGMPFWLSGLKDAVAANFNSDAAQAMRDNLLLVPLTSKFAFISPTKLIVAMPLLALIPLTLLLLSMRRGIRRAPVWYGGRELHPERAATTALAFSNALRTFYSFIYRPTAETEREQAEESNGLPYFTKRLVFTHDVAPIFGPYLFAPTVRFVSSISAKARAIQSGHLNLYLGIIGLLLIAILLVALL